MQLYQHILPYLLYIVSCSHHKTSLDYHMKVDYLMKGYLHFKTIFCNKIAFDVKLVHFFIRRKNIVSFSRYVNFCYIWNLQILKSVKAPLQSGNYTYAYFFGILSIIKMRFGQILVCAAWQIVLHSAVWQILCYDKLVFDLFKKMKHWYLDIIGYWLFGAGC